MKIPIAFNLSLIITHNAIASTSKVKIVEMTDCELSFFMVHFDDKLTTETKQNDLKGHSTLETQNRLK